jgi:hypothetical protein
MRSRLTGHSRQAMARVNMRATSASVCSEGPATSRSLAATAKSGSSQPSSTSPDATVTSVDDATAGSSSNPAAVTRSSTAGVLAWNRSSDAQLVCSYRSSSGKGSSATEMRHTTVWHWSTAAV